MKAFSRWMVGGSLGRKLIKVQTRNAVAWSKRIEVMPKMWLRLRRNLSFLSTGPTLQRLVFARYGLPPQPFLKRGFREERLWRKGAEIIMTHCTVKEDKDAFQVAADFQGVPDEVLLQAEGYKAVGIFVNRKIEDRQVEILKKNGNALVLCCSAGYDNESQTPKLGLTIISLNLFLCPAHRCPWGLAKQRVSAWDGFPPTLLRLLQSMPLPPSLPWQRTFRNLTSRRARPTLPSPISW